MFTRTVLLAAVLTLSPTARAADVPVETLELRESWRRGTVDDDIILGLVGRVTTGPNGDVYVLDSQLTEVMVFSAEGDYLRSIGGPGEGPGEFNQPADMFYGLGGRIGVLQAFPGRIVQLAPDGTPLGNFPLPEQGGGGFQVVLRAEALDDRLVLVGNRQHLDGEQRMQRQFLEALTPEGELIARYHEEDHQFQWGGMEYQEETFVSFQRRWALFGDGRVAAPLSFLDYAIHVWKPDGEIEHVIHRPDFEPLERTGEQRERAQKLFDAVTSFNPRSSFEVADHHASVSQIFTRLDGELWVISSRGIYERPAGAVAMIDVFDRAGAYVRRIELRGDLDPEVDQLQFVGDRLFVVTESLGAAMSALGGGDADDLDDVEPSNLVCFDLVPAAR